MTAPSPDFNPTERSPLLSNSKPSEDEEHGSKYANGNTVPVTGHESDVPLLDEPSTRYLLFVMCGTWLGSFLAAIDSTIIATLTAPISASFNSLSLLSWLASSYFIANAALQPLAGRMTDILSRKWGLLFSNFMFAVGNLVCGLAQDEWVMIFGRVIAGCGGGGLTAISTFIGSDLIPLRKRGMWQGFGNITYGVGAGLGGLLGGWINDEWGWRMAFIILVPFTIVSGSLVYFTVDIPVKHSKKSTLRRIDFLGSFTLVLTLVLLLLGVNSGGNVVSWNHPLIYTTVSLSIISLIGFIYVEANHATEPVIPVRLLVDRTVLAACFTNWFTTMATFAIFFYGPIYFQVKGLSTTQAGARLVPQSLGMAVGSVGSGLVMRWTGRYYYLVVAIMLLFIAANAIIVGYTLTTPLWVTVVSLFMAGTAYSGMLTTTLLALISAVEHQHQAVITSASYAFRSTGSAIGIAIASAVFQNLLSHNLWAAVGDREGAADTIRRLRDSLDVIKQLPESWKLDVQQAYMESLRGVFLTTLGMSVLAGIVCLAMREHILYSSLSRK